MIDLGGKLHTQMFIGRAVFPFQQCIRRGGWFEDVLSSFSLRRSDELPVISEYETCFRLNTGKRDTSYVSGILLVVCPLVIGTVKGEDMWNLFAIKQLFTG